MGAVLLSTPITLFGKVRSVKNGKIKESMRLPAIILPLALVAAETNETADLPHTHKEPIQIERIHLTEPTVTVVSGSIAPRSSYQHTGFGFTALFRFTAL
jgi:hypothetical protein